MSGRRHEHEFEPMPGLPEVLPAGERQLWQGAPSAGGLARRVFHLPLVAAYFALLIGVQAVAAVQAGADAATVARGIATGLLPAGTALALLGLLAWLAARTTLYTLTDRRLVMRVGIVLTVTYNLPLRCIDAAHVHRHGRTGKGTGKGTSTGTAGDLALVLQPGTRIAWLQLWPHVRPWHLRRPQPMLRCLPQVDEVGALVMQAWAAANAKTAVGTRVEPHVPQAPQVPQAPHVPQVRPAALARSAATNPTTGLAAGR